MTIKFSDDTRLGVYEIAVLMYLRSIELRQGESIVTYNIFDRFHTARADAIEDAIKNLKELGYIVLFKHSLVVIK